MSCHAMSCIQHRWQFSTSYYIGHQANSKLQTGNLRSDDNDNDTVLYSTLFLHSSREPRCGPRHFYYCTVLVGGERGKTSPWLDLLATFSPPPSQASAIVDFLSSE